MANMFKNYCHGFKGHVEGRNLDLKGRGPSLSLMCTFSTRHMTILAEEGFEILYSNCTILTEKGFPLKDKGGV